MTSGIQVKNCNKRTLKQGPATRNGVKRWENTAQLSQKDRTYSKPHGAQQMTKRLMTVDETCELTAMAKSTIRT